ncbi:MAG: hypothetical protein HOC95_04000 [Candidatus Diapherotrites archaeon]|nr:hypothetical protein [Candidatus Diapherotrites archaeon]
MAQNGESSKRLEDQLNKTTKLLRAAKRAAKTEKSGTVLTARNDPVYQLTNGRFYFSNGLICSSSRHNTTSVQDLKREISALKRKKEKIRTRERPAFKKPRRGPKR